MEEKKQIIIEQIQQIEDEKAIDYLLEYIKAFEKYYLIEKRY